MYLQRLKRLPLFHPFYLIVDSARWIERLVPVGVKLVQLRLKDQSDRLVRSEIGRAQKICRDNDCTLVVNDYWQAAIDLGCDFLHLGQEDLDTADMKAIKKAGIRFGLSTHDHAELDRALAHSPDYVALGPIYPTTLKQLSWAPQGLEKITEWKSLIGNLPLVAIGGLTLERLPGVLAAGADCAAVSSDVTGNPEPERQVASWLQSTL